MGAEKKSGNISEKKEKLLKDLTGTFTIDS